MSQVLDFITKWWPMFLTIGGISTAINRVAQPLLAPRAPRVAAIVNAFCVDYWMALREIASIAAEVFGVNLPTEAAQKSAALKAAKAAAKGGIVLLALLVAGCAGSFEEARASGVKSGLKLAPPSAECVSLDNAHRDWSSVAATAGLLAGGSGLGQIPEDSTALRIGLAAGTVSMAALAVFATKESDGFASEWAAQCSGGGQ